MPFKFDDLLQLIAPTALGRAFLELGVLLVLISWFFIAQARRLSTARRQEMQEALKHLFAPAHALLMTRNNMEETTLHQKLRQLFLKERYHATVVTRPSEVGDAIDGWLAGKSDVSLDQLHVAIFDCYTDLTLNLRSGRLDPVTWGDLFVFTLNLLLQILVIGAIGFAVYAVLVVLDLVQTTISTWLYLFGIELITLAVIGQIVLYVQLWDERGRQKTTATLFERSSALLSEKSPILTGLSISRKQATASSDPRERDRDTFTSRVGAWWGKLPTWARSTLTTACFIMVGVVLMVAANLSHHLSKAAPEAGSYAPVAIAAVSGLDNIADISVEDDDQHPGMKRIRLVYMLKDVSDEDEVVSKSVSKAALAMQKLFNLSKTQYVTIDSQVSLLDSYGRSHTVLGVQIGWTRETAQKVVWQPVLRRVQDDVHPFLSISDYYEIHPAIQNKLKKNVNIPQHGGTPPATSATVLPS